MKFKVGDKVRIISTDQWVEKNKHKVGDIITLVHSRDSSWFAARGDSYWMNVKCFVKFNECKSHLPDFL